MLAIYKISKPQLQCLHFDFIGNIVEDLYKKDKFFKKYVRMFILQSP